MVLRSITRLCCVLNPARSTIAWTDGCLVVSSVKSLGLLVVRCVQVASSFRSSSKFYWVRVGILCAQVCHPLCNMDRGQRDDGLRRCEGAQPRVQSDTSFPSRPVPRPWAFPCFPVPFAQVLPSPWISPTGATLPRSRPFYVLPANHANYAPMAAPTVTAHPAMFWRPEFTQSRNQSLVLGSWDAIATRAFPVEQRRIVESGRSSCSAAAVGPHCRASEHLADVVNALVRFIDATKKQGCELHELSEAPVCKETGLAGRRLVDFLFRNRQVFHLEQEGDRVIVRVRSACTTSADIVSSTGTTSRECLHGDRLKDWTATLLSACKRSVDTVSSAQARSVPANSVPTSVARTEDSQARTVGVIRSGAPEKDVVKALVNFICERMKSHHSCTVSDLGLTWKMAKKKGTGKLEKFLQDHKDIFQLCKKEHVRCTSSYRCSCARGKTISGESARRERCWSQRAGKRVHPVDACAATQGRRHEDDAHKCCTGHQRTDWRFAGAGCGASFRSVYQPQDEGSVLRCRAACWTARVDDVRQGQAQDVLDTQPRRFRIEQKRGSEGQTRIFCWFARNVQGAHE